MTEPFSAEEEREARIFFQRFGPSNAWTGTGGTAARIIGRLLQERDRLIREIQRESSDCHTCREVALLLKKQRVSCREGERSGDIREREASGDTVE